MEQKKVTPYIKNAIVAISEGILGKLLFNSKINIGEAYSEYMFYEPIIQIINKNWNAKCEVPIKTTSKEKGDKKRIDFVITDRNNSNRCIAIEVKYLKNNKSELNVCRDIEKLKAYKKESKEKDVKNFLMVIWSEQTTRKKHAKKILKIEEGYKNGLKKYHEVCFETNKKRSYVVTVFSIK